MPKYPYRWKKKTNPSTSVGVSNTTKKKIQVDEPKFTPLEQQVIAIQASHPDTILFVECGYKYRFFGKDAEIASKELNIYCNVDHNFQTASIPVHRLFVHVRRLVANGHKVGVVKQTETAAVKATGKNKSAPFTRELTALYTKATLIGEDVDPVFSGELESNGYLVSNKKSTAGHLMCVYESPSNSNSQTLAIVSIMLATGEIIYDVFDDNALRNELESRVIHIEPAEILLPTSISDATKNLITNIASDRVHTDDRIRVEKISDENFSEEIALHKLSDLFKSHDNGKPGTSSYEGGNALDVLKLPSPILCCLHALISYLKDFKLDHMLVVSKNFQRFNPYSNFLQLDACAVKNLELFYNQTNAQECGSLFSVIDHTKTRFGKRLFRRWLSRPLRDPAAIISRLNAVEELLDAPLCMRRLKNLIGNLSDMEKALATIMHQKCSTYEFYQVCDALTQVERIVKQDTVNYINLHSDLIKMLTTRLAHLLDGVGGWILALNCDAAKSGDKTQLFTDNKYPEIELAKQKIDEILEKIDKHKDEIGQLLKVKGFEYVTVSGNEFLIEVKNNNLKNVPRDWLMISSTKAVSRYHSPFVKEAFSELCLAREQLSVVANKCWQDFLKSFESSYPSYQQAVEYLATLDCLFSFSDLAKQSGFVRPEIEAHDCIIEITGGRHPVVDALLGEQEQFVANDTRMNNEGNRCMIVTGPNMGGKSSYIRQVALICIMAQMGSFVPAESARLGILDAIYTRMGAEDDIYKGCSTFMVELQEASGIMQKATPRSLVILDELGRGTSTHDGMAIAYATLNYFVTTKKCLCMFVTHYLPLSQLEKVYPLHVKNYHMAFIVEEEPDTSERAPCDCVAFLYQLVEGPSQRSYGLNVARLADIPSEILQSAQEQSQQLEAKVCRAKMYKQIFCSLMEGDAAEVTSALELIQSVE